jgi:uroporphyrinogen-III decarboxylase
MTGRERVARAMRHQIPDRVPVFCQLSLGHYFLHAGLPAHEVWFTSEGFAEALVRLQRRYRFDGLLVNLPGRPVDLLSRVRRIERSDEGERLFWDDGGMTVIPPDDNPHHYLSESGAPLPRASFDELDPSGLERFHECPGFTWHVYHVPHVDGLTGGCILTEAPDSFLRTVQAVRARVGHEVSVHGEVFSPFTQFMELFGYQEALMGLVTDGGKARAMLDRLTESAIIWAVAQARAGVDAVLVSSAFAGAGFISRTMYAEFVAPFERRLNEAVRAAGVPVYTHTCGRIGDRLDLLAQTAADGLDTLDPPPLGDVRLADAKRTIGRQLFLKGNMNSVALLAFRTTEEVRAEGLGCLEAGKPGGGYILSTACSVAPRVEPWKLELLVPLAEEFGRYDTGGT